MRALLSEPLRLADLIDGAVDDVDAAGPVDLHGAEEERAHHLPRLLHRRRERLGHRHGLK